MNSRRLEVADVLRTFGAEYRETYPVSCDQLRVLSQLPLCRTAALGGHRLRCDSCGHEEISYNSCRNRHCPKCRAAARAEWLEARQRDLLEVPYFHVVFTLPDDLSAIALQNKKACYNLLFRAVAETLRTIAGDSKHLGAEIGFLAVLHTWTQTLLHHPHVHCVVPGGGISSDRQAWIACRESFFLPVRVLSRLFRRLFLEGLQHAYDNDDLEFHGQLAALCQATAWKCTVDELRQKEWVVYAKPPFGGPNQVLKYLARYTHRVAIANARLLAIQDDNVRFRWKDRAANARSRTMTLSGTEFVRRFLLHTLPKGFVTIRHFGFLANCRRKEAIPLVRELIQQQHPQAEPATSGSSPSLPVESADSIHPCPSCDTGHLVVVEELLPGHPALVDTS